MKNLADIICEKLHLGKNTELPKTVAEWCYSKNYKCHIEAHTSDEIKQCLIAYTAYNIVVGQNTIIDIRNKIFKVTEQGHNKVIDEIMNELKYVGAKDNIKPDIKIFNTSQDIIYILNCAEDKEIPDVLVIFTFTGNFISIAFNKNYEANILEKLAISVLDYII